MSRGKISFDDILAMHSEDRAQLWIMQSFPDDMVAGVVVTQVVTYEGGANSLKVFCGGGVGAMKRGLDVVISRLETFARELGCVSVIIEGRRGWEKIFPGYDFVSVTIEKRLD
jgi:hypothetical protein